ncbi:uncharacterized protein LACBIDRAFT_316330 [Laccaria bicolor S238N-H82]|uniref:Predicted protein n=1 Tax=Laccaria bicolor (strain S238N-H82 / ATCC MYA-4686) TaxID=486041 RepID=B0E0Q7_LACBS|nr:uncharacterized protein LACBIDRAFT_316330 [Laccaria bicolor S238N-H82]EDQ99571.1 predicted protein [Laccaria bicolor S238N-H82]|eukprot:XP_001889795.1 predicted protein [Laccaria bicolor S238N-H82]
MGVPGISKILELARRVQTLTEFATKEGFQLNPHGDNMVRVGVDVSVWICQAQAAVHSMPRTQQGENPALRIIFFRICHLLAQSIQPIFIADGPNRPRVKRGVNVRADKPHWMEAYVKDFVQEAGCPMYHAPGEAEAELAQLTAHGLIKAVLTTDFDVFLFGGTYMIKPPNVKTDGDRITYYTSDGIQAQTSLTCAKLIFIAILSGGDYDQVGLPGCGLKIAHQLAQGELADLLFTAATTLPQHDLEDFLRDWRNKLANELLRDPHGLMNAKHPKLAQNIPSDFPKFDTLQLYISPVTSWSENGKGPDTTSWALCQLNLAKLAVLCEKSFSWGSAGVINERFQKNVWPAAVMRMLLKPVDTPGAVDEQLSHLSLLHIRQKKLGPGGPATGANVDGFSVETASLALARETASSLDENIRKKTLQQMREPFYPWIPSRILKQKVPDLTNEFGARTRKKTKRCQQQQIITDSDDGVVMTAAATADVIASTSQMTCAPDAMPSSSGMALAAAAGSSLNPIAIDEDESKGGFLGFIDLM